MLFLLQSQVYLLQKSNILRPDSWFWQLGQIDANHAHKLPKK